MTRSISELDELLARFKHDKEYNETEQRYEYVVYTDGKCFAVYVFDHYLVENTFYYDALLKKLKERLSDLE